MQILSSPFDVLCVGHASFDLIFSVDHQPAPDEKTSAGAFLSCGGGPAANAAATVARLGGAACFCGYLGRDFFGDRHLNELRDAAVDTSLVHRGEAPTALSAVFVKPDGTRSIVNYRSPDAQTASVSKELPESRAVLFDGHEPLISPDIAVRAKHQGSILILDAGSLHPGVEALLPLVDYAVCSEKFTRQFTGVQDPENGLAALRAHCACVIVTLGERGLCWADGHGSGRRAAFHVQAVDTTGAGDVFHGAFALALARGRPWVEVLDYASAAAALSCTKLGGRTSIPTAGELEEFMRSAGG